MSAGDRFINNPNSNKDIDIRVNVGGTPTNAVTVEGATGKLKANQGANLGALASPPASPVNGDIYYDTGSNKFKGYQNGAWSDVAGGGSGSGGINYILNPGAESDLTGWVRYADAAQSTPVDGTGGSPSISLSRDDGSPLRGVADFSMFHQAANRQGEGVSYDFAIDAADRGKRLSISFDLLTSSAYVANDMGVYIYDVDASTLIIPSFVNIPATNNNSAHFQAYFNATSSTNYRLIFHIQSTGTAMYTFDFDNVIVGPQEIAQGVPVGSIDMSTSNWIGWEPHQIKSFSGQRIGEYLHVEGTLQVKSGAVGVSDPLYFNLPTGLSADSAQYNPIAGRRNAVGRIFEIKSDAGDAAVFAASYAGVIYPDPSDFTKMRCGNEAQSGQFAQYTAGVSGAGGVVSFDFRVKIAQWAGSSVSLTNSRVEFASNSNTTNAATDDTSFAYGAEGSLIPNGAVGTAYSRRVRFQTPIQSTDSLHLQFYFEGKWSENPWNQYAQAPANYGALIIPVNGTSTDVVAQFQGGGYTATSTTFGQNGDPWSNLYTAGYKWRVVKSSNPLSIGNGAVLATAMTNEEATALGLKQYLSSGSYSSGGAPAITGTGWTTTRASFVPYQMQDGIWRLKFNIRGLVSLSGGSYLGLTIAGVSPNTSYPYQAITASHQENQTNYNIYAIAAATGPTLAITFAGAVTNMAISGDIELDSKPNWAY